MTQLAKVLGLGIVYYSTSSSNSESDGLQSNMNHLNSHLNPASIEPWFITGFVDGEGTFSVSLAKNSNSRLGWIILVNFSVNLHKKDEELLKLIQLYFGGGRIYKGSKDSLVFKIFDIEQNINTVIPHFDKFPLQTQKKADF